jgi:excisionase family DNA binding protein
LFFHAFVLIVTGVERMFFQHCQLHLISRKKMEQYSNRDRQGSRNLNPSPDPQSLLVNSREAAKLLSISERSLWSLKASGSIPHVRIGRLVRYDRQDLQSWIEEQKQRNVTKKRGTPVSADVPQDIKTDSSNTER